MIPPSTYDTMSPEERSQIAAAIVLMGTKACDKIFGIEKVSAILFCYPKMRIWFLRQLSPLKTSSLSTLQRIDMLDRYAKSLKDIANESANST